MIIIYDQSINSNEWFIVLLLIIGFTLVWKLPKKFSTKESLIYLVLFIFLGIVFDHTISIEPFDYYDVNDSSAYELMDFLSYMSFGPFGYFFIYFYHLLNLKSIYNPIYIFIWTIIAILTEFVANTLGVFHYKNGYKLEYSFSIYLLILTTSLYFYKLLDSRKANALN